MWDTITVEEIGRTLLVKLNRPGTLNALTPELRREILDVLRNYEDNVAIKCVVFTGEGRAFSAGADIRYLSSIKDESEAKSYSALVSNFLEYVEGYPKVTVGAVNGPAFGGGLELLLCLDLVVASEDAKFGQSELNVGLIPGGGGTQRLPRLIGLKRAKQMIFTGEAIDAETALDWGLVNLVVPRDQLISRSLEICAKISSKSGYSLRAAKRLVTRSATWSLAEGLKAESEEYSRILLSDDAKEGLNAFLEKRNPNYRN
jgi:enoyl-CoA hydratase/carnithine racemase